MKNTLLVMGYDYVVTKYRVQLKVLHLLKKRPYRLYISWAYCPSPLMAT